ncbi:histidine phosphatase family protein [Plantactinospora endophytica]|uniref:Phosphoglycerate mutase n=1 Tax=Plantactinospora endophytica TaxID=673535 RepID=A0ABQ4DYP5_9ACTN|nr:histidine phosphatase family protein [Plantactinospora endophytica]GIG87580.1 phosphoglycerate mutase [Plantactinospora endophytica]
MLRHGQSTANAAFVEAAAAGRPDTDVRGRDRDVQLSTLGREQAAASGRRLAALPAERRPQAVICSPYRRARQTWRIASAAAGASGVRLPEASVDERLHDRLMGEWELLTGAAIAQRFPAEAERRRATDEFHYRPPGGESLLDVGSRLVPLLDDAHRTYPGQRLLLVAHDAVVLMLRHLVEGLSLDDLRAVVAAGPVANASFTRWTRNDDRMTLAEYNSVAHLSTGD